MDRDFQEQLLAELGAMSMADQRRVVEYARSLRGSTLKPLPPGKPFDEVRHLLGSLDVESAAEMREAIGGCRRADSNGDGYCLRCEGPSGFLRSAWNDG